MALAADAPSALFNAPGQARTRTCVEMKGDKVPLRFADGTPTGWFARGDDPSKQGGRHAPCSPGTLEMDVHEVLTTAGGMKLFFHPGGGPTHYRDYVANGQYGHVALEDLQTTPATTGDIIGKPAPVGGVQYFITPTRIPRDMWYKPNVSDGASGSTYYTYGNPGYDKTGGRGDWTYINWSWVQNGGAVYPKNICAGGGMVRALGKRDALFDACQVEAITGYSYGAENRVNGRVTAFYGRSFAGPGEQGSEVYGWMPHSYQKSGELIIPCVRRAKMNETETVAPPATASRMERMAWNLLHPSRPTAEQRRTLRTRYAAESDIMARMELLTEWSRMDDLETVRDFLKVLIAEKGPRVREQVIVLLGFLAATPEDLDNVANALVENYHRADLPERVRTLDVFSNLGNTRALDFAASIWRARSNERERDAAADAVLKLVPRLKVGESLWREILDSRSKIRAGL